MHADEETDGVIGAGKRPNNGGLPPAEAVEQRTSPKGNGGRAAAARTLSRGTASNGLAAVRQAARRSKHARFTALLHHISIDLLSKASKLLSGTRRPGSMVRRGMRTGKTTSKRS